MYRLTDAEMSSIQAYLDKARRDLAVGGFRVRLESDLADWVALMENAPKIVAVSPTFDPRYSHLHPGNSFWISIRTETDRVAACQCHRLFITDDVVDLVRSYKLFFDRVPVLNYRPLSFAVPDDAPVLAGRISYGGGLWVHPDFRGTGLGHYTPRIARALSLRHFDADWNFALAPETKKRLELAQQTFGVSNRFPCVRGYYPPNDTDGAYQVVYMSRQELLNQIAKDTQTPNGIRPRQKVTAVSNPKPAKTPSPRRRAERRRAARG